MLFPTVEFVVFFAILFLLYWYVFTRKLDRKILLVVANLVFYYFSGAAFTLLMLALIGFTWLGAIFISKIKNYKPRRLAFTLITALQILFLVYFKEGYRFFSELSASFPCLLPESLYSSLLASTSIIPLGVSYYVFKCCSYLFDVYLGKLALRKSVIDVVLYVSFFPQIFSGPIVNATFFFNQLDDALTADQKNYFFIDFDRATLLILLGLAKKAIVATFLSLLVTNPIFANPQSYNPLLLVFAAISYSVVIYADFSGYSDMAIGIGLLLGFQTTPNFNRPYAAKNITDFWRRWHISFSRWLQEYIYQAFGGSRFGIARTLFALFATMLIAGFWHGAKLTFILWGGLQGLALCIERLLKHLRSTKKGPSSEPAAPLAKATGAEPNEGSEASNQTISSPDEVSGSPSPEVPPQEAPKTISLNPVAEKHPRFPKALGYIGTFLFATISWVFFRADSLDEALLFFRSLANFAAPLSGVHPFCLFLVVLTIALQYIPKTFTEKAITAYRYVPFVLKVLLLTAAFLAIKLFTTSGIPEFIYFQF